MAIKGITDKRTLPRLGKIRTGVKKISQKGNEYPEEVPYFVLNPLEEVLDKEGNILGTRHNEHVQRIIDICGEKPTELKVVFPVDDLTLCADPYMKWWGGNVKKKKALLNCIGDGEYAHYSGPTDKEVVGLNDPSIPPGITVVHGKLANRICNKDFCPQALAGLCKPNMNLRLLLPEISMFGVFQIDTTSSQAMESILSSVDVARNALRLHGISSIAGVPMILYRERTPNKHNNVNYILKIRVAERALDEEKLKIQQRKTSLLALGNETIEIEPLRIDEPNYDLLPQSLHGHYQTGDLLPEPDPKLALPTSEEAEVWVQDPQVVEKFKKLGVSMKTPVTPAKMLARARKHSSKADLLQYLDSQLELSETA